MFSQYLIFSFLPYQIKMKFCNCSHVNSHEYWLTMKIIMKMITVSPMGLIEGIFGYFIFLLESSEGETQFCRKVAKNCFHLYLMNYRRYHCVSYVKKNSRDVRITWLKENIIGTKFEEARAWQSWGGNLRTPCNIQNQIWPLILATGQLVSIAD